jgi:beta-galactosidase
VCDDIRPQDNGNRSDVRWAAFTNAAGQGLEVIGQRPLNVSAWPYTQADMESATHPHQLRRRDVNTVFLDDQLIANKKTGNSIFRGVQSKQEE